MANIYGQKEQAEALKAYEELIAERAEETKKRDYKHEYELRKKRVKRIHADLKPEQAEAFLKHLDGRGVTFVRWLEDRITEELGGVTK
jgi:hypothetical protein